MLMRSLAEVDGVEVIDCACDGVEALEKIERLQPDLLTLDVQMPKLDGLGVLREINRRSIETIVLMVSSITAEGAPATVDALLNGAMDCILKPSGLDAKTERHDLRDALAERINAILLARSDGETCPRAPQNKSPRRRPVSINFPQYAKTIKLGHLHVEREEIGLQSFNFFKCLNPITCTINYFNSINFSERSHEHLSIET
jgi:chemotaxis response regulator CheB